MTIKKPCAQCPWRLSNPVDENDAEIGLPEELRA